MPPDPEVPEPELPDPEVPANEAPQHERPANDLPDHARENQGYWNATAADWVAAGGARSHGPGEGYGIYVRSRSTVNLDIGTITAANVFDPNEQQGCFIDG